MRQGAQAPVDAKLADVRAIVYLRISSDRTGLEAGVTRQREDCLQRCSDRGWDVVSVESDNDVSATTGKHRPGFEAVLKAVDAGSVQVIVAWAVDRLQRSRRDEARLYELCQGRGVMLSLVKGSDIDFSTAAGRYVADALGSVARMETEMKSERQQRSALQKARDGRPAGGRRPFGYEEDGITVRPAEAAAVRRGYHDFLAGVPLSQIARDWNSRGFVTGQARRGAHAGEPSPWRRDSVRVVLSNPRNIGQRWYRGEMVAPAVWSAIVDEATFRAVRAILEDPARMTGATSARALLTGLATCSVCDATVHTGGGRGKGTKTYRCAGSTGHVCRRADPVDDYIEQIVIDRLSRPDAAGLLIDQDLPDLETLRREAIIIRSRLDTLATGFADGDLTASQLRTATNRLRGKLAEVEARMAAAGRVDVLGPLVHARDVAAAWKALSTARKRAVIDVLMTVQIRPPGRGIREFRPETVAVEWREDQ